VPRAEPSSDLRGCCAISLQKHLWRWQRHSIVRVGSSHLSASNSRVHRELHASTRQSILRRWRAHDAIVSIRAPTSALWTIISLGEVTAPCRPVISCAVVIRASGSRGISIVRIAALRDIVDIPPRRERECGAAFTAPLAIQGADDGVGRHRPCDAHWQRVILHTVSLK